MCVCTVRRSYLQEKLRPVPQVVGKDGSVKSLDALLIQPALTAGVILGQLLKVWPAGHLNKDAKPFFRAKIKDVVTILSR